MCTDRKTGNHPYTGWWLISVLVGYTLKIKNKKIKSEMGMPFLWIRKCLVAGNER